MILKYLNESTFNSLINESYEEDEDVYTYNGYPISSIKWFVWYEKEFENGDREQSSKEEFNAFQNNELEDEEIEQIDMVVKASYIETRNGRYTDIVWNGLDYETPSDDISGDLSDWMEDTAYYLSLNGYNRIIKQTQDGGYECDLEPSLDMNDIDSVNRCLEFTYGIDDNNPLYILTDGRGLNSDTQDGIRGTDHHLTYEEDSYTVEYLLRNGAIRMQPESPGIELAVQPNQLQSEALKEWLQRYRGNTFYLDIASPNDGQTTIASATYYDMQPRVVMAQIYNYFNNGIKPGTY